MISLAPFLYRDVYAEDGGPIDKVVSSLFPIFSTPSFQATAYLRPDLVHRKPTNVVFGTADGTGSAATKNVAQHMAISEALERWAHDECSHSEPRKYGFDLDRTSNGMAAFPGFKWQARRRAKMEALERFALVGWWEGRLDCVKREAPYPNVGMIRINHDQPFGEVVVLYHKTHAGFVSYGHAAGSNLASAAARAAVELARCEYVIAKHRARGGIAPVSNAIERRCLHFSSPEGYTAFLERVHSRPEKPAPKWQTVFDGEIQGPWSKWTTVWRHCVEMPTYDFLNPNANFFLW